MKEGRYCATCANWFPIKSSATQGPGVLTTTSGECHRYAPRPLLADRDAIKCPALFWPTTDAGDVCGEWYYGGLRSAALTSDETAPSKTAPDGGQGRPLKEDVVAVVRGASPKRPA